MSFTELIKILNSVGGIGGVAAATWLIIKELLARRTRNATAEVTELTADELRVKMADNIAKNLQIQLDAARKDLTTAFAEIAQLKGLVEELTVKLKAKTTQLYLVEAQQDLDRRKIFLLEKAAIEQGIELPYEVFNES